MIQATNNTQTYMVCRVSPLVDPGDTQNIYTHDMQGITPLVDPGYAQNG